MFSNKISQEYKIRLDVVSVLICVQTVCKGYQQTTKNAINNEIVKNERTSVEKIKLSH